MALVSGALIVFVCPGPSDKAPVYANATATTLTDYVRRVGDLESKPVALVFTAAGDANPALQAMAAPVASRMGVSLAASAARRSAPIPP